MNNRLAPSLCETDLLDALARAAKQATSLAKCVTFGDDRVVAKSIEEVCVRQIKQMNPDGYVDALSTAARKANDLAKRLRGQERRDAYFLKDACLSALILCNGAVANGIEPDGTVGIDILTTPIARLHAWPRGLSDRAQVFLDYQLRGFAA